jgi:hypothetical protein
MLVWLQAITTVRIPIAAISMVLALGAGSAVPSPEGAIEGRVTCPAGHPLPFATVVVLGTKLGSSTGRDGTFQIHAPIGSYTIQASYIGYQSLNRIVRIGPHSESRPRQRPRGCDVEFVLKRETFLECEVVISTGGDPQSPPIKLGRCTGDIHYCESLFGLRVSGNPHSLTATPRLVLDQNHPTPLMMSEIAFELPSPARTRLGVYDFGGGLVTQLVDQMVGRGKHVVRWDGRDDRGLCSAGVYFCRLEVADSVTTRRMLLLK